MAEIDGLAGGPPLQDYSDKTVCVVDHGLFVELAVTLSPFFGRTLYHSPWAGAFPKSNATLVGKGVPGVERADDLWGVLDEVDLFVFPDVYGGALQLHLESLGKRVWGSRMGEELELYRRPSKLYLRACGVPIGPFEVVVGLDALRAYLKERENQWVKISRTRGDFETFHAKNYRLIEPKLDDLEHNLGAKKRVMEFVVEDGIDDAVEAGYDGYCVDGQFPAVGMVGIEVKDKGYIGVVRAAGDLAEPVAAVNRMLAGTLRRYRYRNFLSTELRVTRDRTPWLIDPCMRMGSPPGEVMQVLYANWPDILWHGAEGRLVDPVPTGRYAAEVLLRSAWADKNWQAIQFPPELRPWIKFRNLTVIDGQHYVVPQEVGIPEIGAVVAVGETLEEVVATVKDRAKRVEGYYLEVFDDSLDDAAAEFGKLEDCGVAL